MDTFQIKNVQPMWKCTAQRSNTQYNADNAWNPKHNEDTFLNKYKHSTFHIVQRVSQHFELSKIKRVTERFIIEICISTSLKEERNNLLDSKLLTFLHTDKSILFLSHNCFPSQCKQARKAGTGSNLTAFSRYCYQKYSHSAHQIRFSHSSV